jgi:hypothetical protein
MLKRVGMMLDPNSMFGNEFEAVRLNVARSGTAKDPERFNPNDAKSEFGADWGLTTCVQSISSQLAAKCKNCSMVGIRKEDSRRAYIFHLFDNDDNVKDFTKKYSLFS